MPAKNPDLHGFAPDACPAALLLIDWINDLEFTGGRKLLKPAIRAADRVAVLKKRARDAGIPFIYVNDNFGRWRSNFGEVVQHCLGDDVTGRPLALRLPRSSICARSRRACRDGRKSRRNRDQDVTPFSSGTMSHVAGGALRKRASIL